MGAARHGTLLQRDTYFRVPRGRLKLRESDGETAELIYYERSEETGERWSRFSFVVKMRAQVRRSFSPTPHVPG